ncbi:6-pyruvoyl-tetrahydropterin synthase-related protein [Tunturiibacter empetritectus]|uniref:Membrane protein 6-pyruvoyl-tetrahydropterin synthase-related domain-containing protein n=1 Tax=Tunturiibacter lichenicola TaxID=2051959 RepID=A0A852VMF3_9BACT|nr:6-pyruvoyl-tetrahydropterin synthase-related protein [Edaphobacter lichenicola]NYF90572.1 hypothetical protein [Edaphobacter lichenicola]
MRAIATPLRYPQHMQRDRLPYLLIPLAACIAILPLLLNGCSCGHDFDFHLLNWMEAARQFTHGNLHPHWAYTAAYNAGEPRFVFYPPLSWTLGAILTLLFPITATPILYTWLALTLSGLALHRLAREFTSPTAALVAAVLYTVNPYMLFTAYERTAYAELLATAFIPLLLHAILRQRVTIPRIAIPITLLWLTNAPAAVMSCYTLALLTLVRVATDLGTDPDTGPGPDADTDPGAPSYAVSSHRMGYSRHARTAVTETSGSIHKPGAPYLDSEMWASRASAIALATTSNARSQTPLSLTLNTIAGTALGLALAAFYLLPAAYERRYVQIAMAIIPNMRIQDNFLFHHTGDTLHDQVLHTASLLALILLATTLTALIISITKLRSPSKPQSQTPNPAPQKPSNPERQIPAGTNHQPSSLPKHDIVISTEATDSIIVRREVESPPHLVHIGNALLASLAILTITIALLLTPLTSILWNHTPELAFLQFPWRLLAILAAIMSLAVALAIRRTNLNPTISTAITIALAAALTSPAYALFHQSCDEEDTPTAREALFHSNRGTDPTDEYTPTTADNDSLAQTDPPYWLSEDPNAKAPTETQPAPAPTHLTLNPPTPEDLILNLRDYPAWHITDNGSLLATRDQRDDGLIAIHLPAGPARIAITYARTPDQTLGDAISLVSLAVLLFILRRNPSPSSPHPSS